MPSFVLLALSVLAPSAIRLVILVAPWRAAVRARAHRATKCSFLMLIDLPFFRRDREKVGRGQGGAVIFPLLTQILLFLSWFVSFFRHEVNYSRRPVTRAMGRCGMFVRFLRNFISCFKNGKQSTFKEPGN